METAIKETKAMRYKVLIPVIIVVTLIGGVILGKVLLPNFGFGPSNSNLVTVSKEQQTQDITQERQTAITRVVSRVSDAIVGINVEEEREVRNPFFDDPFFRQFFGGDGSPQKQVVRGLGSGYIISSDGYILTNHHVAGNATKISVTLTTGETVSARLIGADAVSDVALLKIDRSGLPFLNFGNSDNVIIGEWVIALGNPFGLFEINNKPTVTVGVVSANKMKVNADGNKVYIDMIQTDASINSGNSGGPLLDAEGNVIGMNTIIYTGGQYSTGSIGVGFAISINRVKKIMEELKQNGSINRNFNVGFRIQGIDDRIAEYLKLPNKQGVVVVQVQQGGTADDAGLQAEDVIIEANGQKINTEQDLIFTVNDMRVGDTLRLKVLRNGNEREVELKL
jgi:serine protease Do